MSMFAHLGDDINTPINRVRGLLAAYDGSTDAEFLIHQIRAAVKDEGAGEQQLQGTRDEAANETSEQPQAIRADALNDFLQFVASNGACNGADGQGQRFYDECLNPWLAGMAAEFYKRGAS